MWVGIQSSVSKQQSHRAADSFSGSVLNLLCNLVQLRLQATHVLTP